MGIQLSQLIQGILVSLAIMGLGWQLSRKQGMNDQVTSFLNNLLVDMTFPMMILTQLVNSAAQGRSAARWSIPLLGILIYVLGALGGLLCSRLVSNSAKRPTFIFLAATPNWIFLPLIIMETLKGEEGVRLVLLYNIGFLLALWTLGVWILQGLRFNGKTLVIIAKNPALWATLLGTLWMLFPSLQDTWPLHRQTIGLETPLLFLSSIAFQALTMLGKLTIPLSLLITGSLLQKASQLPRESWSLTVGSLLSRMFLAPLLTLIFFHLAPHLGFSPDPLVVLTGLLIAAMPAGVNTAALCLRFGGHPNLASGAVLYGHLLIILSLPLWLMLFGR